MENKRCLQCGHCCLESSCGLGVKEPCEHLIPINKQQYKCAHYPFDHLDAFTMLCLNPGGGCGYDGQHEKYKNLVRGGK